MHVKALDKAPQSLAIAQRRGDRRRSANMASSLVNDDDDTASSTPRNTQQSGSSSNNNNSGNNNTLTPGGSSNAGSGKMQGSEAKAKKENLQQRKQELEMLLNEKNWLLQQLQKQESQLLKGQFEYMNFNDFISSLAVQYKQEQGSDAVSSLGGTSQFSANEEAILRRKPLSAKENHLQHHNVLHRRQSEISNRSSEYDNYPHHDTMSTHSDGAASAGGRSAVGGSSLNMHQAQQAQQQYNAKSALKKRSATVAGTTQQTAGNLHMLRQQHQQHLLEQQQQLQQHMAYKQHHYHHPQQHLFKQHVEHHQVLMPHLQYATQKFYYTTLQPTQQQQQQQPTTQLPQQQSQQPQQQQQQQQFGRYIKSQQNPAAQQLPKAQPQSQNVHHISQHAQQQSPNHSQHHALYTSQLAGGQNPQLLLTPPHGASGGGSHMDNISLYSLNSNNVATLHRQAQQQQPIIVQCDKYYLSPTSHHVSHHEGGGFIKSSQNIKEYISPVNSPQQQPPSSRERKLASQTNLSNRLANTTPSMDAISLAPSYMSMETVDYMTVQATASSQQPVPPNLRWRSQTNLPPPGPSPGGIADMKSHSSDMLNNNQYYHQPTPTVTQVKPYKPADEMSINSYTSDTHKKSKPKQWMESSLDGPVIRQTQHVDHNDNNQQQRSKLSSQSLNTARHYSMSAAQAKAQNACANNNGPSTKLSQSTSYLNQMDAMPPSACSISQVYNVETLSPQNTPPAAHSYKYAATAGAKPPARPPLYIHAGAATTGSGTLQQQQLQHQQVAAISPSGSGHLTVVTSPAMVAVASSSGLSPDIRIESPKNITVVQPATFQPYKEVTKPFEMSDFYKYSTKYRQKEGSSTGQGDN